MVPLTANRTAPIADARVPYWGAARGCHLCKTVHEIYSMLSHAAVGFLRCRHKCGPNRVPDIKTAASAAQIAGAVPTKIGVELVDWVKDPSFY
jgi:hypothetical protein